MAAPSSRLEAWTQYLAARLGASALEMLDLRSAMDGAAAVGQTMYRLDRRHRERAMGHLRMCFPELEQPQLDALCRESFEHFVQLVIEVLAMPRKISSATWPQHIQLGPLQDSLRLLNAQKPVLMVTGHMGNWEALGYLMGLLGYPIHAIARPIDNPLVNDWLLGIRERRGLNVITKWKSTDRMIEVLSRGEGLGFIADQNAGDNGLFVPFFGKLASTYKSIALLAISQNIPVICGQARRLGMLRFEMCIDDVIMPEDWADMPDPVYYVTARYMRSIETMIRTAPAQYLWMHRRWKSRPRHERQGKPVPAALMRKIESLPWMNSSTLQSVQQPLPAQ